MEENIYSDNRNENTGANLHEKDKKFFSSIGIAEIGLVKATETDRRAHGYITSLKTGDDNYLTGEKIFFEERNEIEKIVDEILDAFDDIIDQGEDLVMRGNLVDSLNSLVNNLWEHRTVREKEFKKYIVLIQSIIRGEKLEDVEIEALKAIRSVFQKLKLPKISEPDITSAKKIIKDSGFDIYRPLRNDKKIKIIIKEVE